MPLLLIILSMVASPSIMDDRKAKVWKFKSKQSMPLAPTTISDVYVGNRALAVKQDGSRCAAVVKDGVGIFDGVTLKLLHTIAVQRVTLRIQFAGDRLYLSHGDQISVYDEAGKEIWLHKKDLRSGGMTVSPSGSYVLSGPKRKPTKVLDGKSGQVLRTFENVEWSGFVDEKHLLQKSGSDWILYNILDGSTKLIGLPATMTTGRRRFMGWSPKHLPGLGILWLERKSRELHFCLNGTGSARFLGKLPAGDYKKFAQWKQGVLWAGIDELGSNILKIRVGKAAKFSRFEITDLLRDHVYADASGKTFFSLRRTPNSRILSNKIVRYDLKQAKYKGGSVGGDAVFAKKNMLRLGLRLFNIKKGKFLSKTPAMEITEYSRTHGLGYNSIIHRKTLKETPFKNVQNSFLVGSDDIFKGRHTLHVVDGGGYLYHVNVSKKPVTTSVYKLPTSKLAYKFEATQFVRVGPKGISYSIQKIAYDLMELELLEARSNRGKILWSLAGPRNRPVDVHPQGKYVSVESGILDAKTGKWIVQWSEAELLAPPRFNSAGNYAIAVVRAPEASAKKLQCKWVFYNLKKGKVEATAFFPAGAIPVDVSKKAKQVVAKFGTFVVQRVFTR